MRKYLIIPLLLTACATQTNHRIITPNVTNFAREIERTDDFITLTQWVSVLRREKIKSSNATPTYEVMKSINDECNKKPYSPNPAWPTPEEFKRERSGDCKGFAICKYYALRKAGFKASQLNFWSGDYMGRPHLLLVAELEGQEYVLDIGAESVIPLAKDYFYKRFMPAYRFNENGWDVN